MAWIMKLLQSIVPILNTQLKNRVPPALRAALFGLAIAAVATLNYRGLYNADGSPRRAFNPDEPTAQVDKLRPFALDSETSKWAWALVVAVFGYSINNSASGEGFSMSLSQVPTSARPTAGTATFLSPVIANPVMPGNAAVVVTEEKAVELVKEGSVEARPIAVVQPAVPIVVTPPVVMTTPINLGEEFDAKK